MTLRTTRSVLLVREFRVGLIDLVPSCWSIQFPMRYQRIGTNTVPNPIHTASLSRKWKSDEKMAPIQIAGKLRRSAAFNMELVFVSVG